MAIEFDPFDPAYFPNPFGYYKAIRDDYPVLKRDNKDYRIWPHYWMISRATDVRDVLADWRTFSSATGTLIDTDISLLPPNMFNMDPPRHDELRSILSRNLTTSRIAALEPHVRDYAHGLVDEFAETGGFDAQLGFGHLIPTITMCVLMDLPVEGREQFLKWNLDTLGGADFTSPEALAAYGEMHAYWETLVAQRLFGLALGYEDLLDHDELRHDPVLGVLLGKLACKAEEPMPLAGKSTLNRLEHAPSAAKKSRYHKIGQRRRDRASLRRAVSQCSRQTAARDRHRPRRDR